MKRKGMLWLAIAAFVVYSGVLTFYSFPKLENNLDKSASALNGFKSLDNSELDWNGRNGYLTVPADMDKNQAENVKNDIESIQGVRKVEIIFDNARVSSKENEKVDVKEKTKEKVKAKDGKFRLDWKGDDRKLSGEFNKANADELHNLFGVKIQKTTQDAAIKDETMKKIKGIQPELFSSLSQGALEVDGDKIKVSGIACEGIDVDGLKSKWSSLSDVDIDIKAPKEKQEQAEPVQQLADDYEFEYIYFESGGSVLANNSIKTVDEIADVLNEYKGVDVVIVGHTDNWGDNSSNLTLSKQRAEAIMNMLVEKGIQKSRMTTDGMGEKQPIANNATALGREKNRRVEIHVKENS